MGFGTPLADTLRGTSAGDTQPLPCLAKRQRTFGSASASDGYVNIESDSKFEDTSDHESDFSAEYTDDDHDIATVTATDAPMIIECPSNHNVAHGHCLMRFPKPTDRGQLKVVRMHISSAHPSHTFKPDPIRCGCWNGLRVRRAVFGALDFPEHCTEPSCGAFFCHAPLSHAVDFTWCFGKGRPPTSLGDNQVPSWIHDVSSLNLFRLSGTDASHQLKTCEAVQFQADIRYAELSDLFSADISGPEMKFMACSTS